MMKELRSDEPYEVSPGCPTITFKLAEESLMLPWSSFASGIFKGGRIELIFQDWKIGIDGDELEEVWRLVQVQDLRVVRTSCEKSIGIHTNFRIRQINADKLSDS